MSETQKVLIDYEFQFTSGEPIFVSIQEGRDTVHSDREVIEITAKPSKDVEEVATIMRHKLNGWRRTRRIVRDEATGEEMAQAPYAGRKWPPQ